MAAIPRREFFVRLFTKEEMIIIFELREVLEGLAARRAADADSAEELMCQPLTKGKVILRQEIETEKKQD